MSARANELAEIIDSVLAAPMPEGWTKGCDPDEALAELVALAENTFTLGELSALQAALDEYDALLDGDTPTVPDLEAWQSARVKINQAAGE